MNPLLFGANSEERIIAVHPVGDGTMRVYHRREAGVAWTDCSFYPFFFLSSEDRLAGYRGKHWIKALAGDNYYRFLCAFTGWSAMWDAVRHVIDQYNASSKAKAESFAEVPPMHLRPDAVSQFLLQSGRTLFKGMEFDDLHRLQMAVRALSADPRRPGNPQRPEDRIIAIAVSDNRGWEEVLGGRDRSEAELLEAFFNAVRQRDPDVLEGHNIVHSDLPYLLNRCKLLGIEPVLGREGAAPRAFDGRFLTADRSFDVLSQDIAGRHVIDTAFLAQSYDASKRDLESTGLQAVAGHFGIGGDPGAVVPPERLRWVWDHDPELLRRAVLEDARRIAGLSELLSRGIFYQTQMLPYNFGASARLGASAKIESLLLREYIRVRHSVPRPHPVTPITGGATEIYLTGVVGPVLNVDVESLYPSIMLSEKIAPRSEQLGVFLSLLGDLTSKRLKAKQSKRDARSPQNRTVADAVQSAYKILVNSFYGYLGYSKALFNDPEAADAVTRSGQEHLRSLVEKIREAGGTVVEVDTDGIFFIPPSGTSRSSEKQLVAKIARHLPGGFSLSIDGRYRKMLSYKKKNYALLDEDGNIIIRGSSLTARSIEKLCREFLRGGIAALLDGNVGRLHQLYSDLRRKVVEQRLTVADFARTETLRESGAEYLREVEAGTRNKAAAYEVALSAGRTWRPGEKISWYVTGNDPAAKDLERLRPAEEWDPGARDENVPYYLRRLDEAASRFSPFFKPQDFRAIFSSEDLFPFSPEGIQIITQAVAGGPKEEEEEEGSMLTPEPKIWLAEDAGAA